MTDGGGGGQVLPGGNVTGGVRVGRSVRRRRGPYSEAVHALLRHLQENGFPGAPAYLGLDEEGREVLSFIEGLVPTYPLPSMVRTDEAIAEVGRLIRRFHEAVADFRPPPDAVWWRMPGAPQDGDVVCHNDLAPYNTVYRNGLPVAFIDWDTASPAPREWDIAHAVWRFAPVSWDAVLPAAEVGRRVRLLCDGYGLAVDRSFLRTLQRRQQVLHDTVRHLAAQGVPAFVAMWGTDHSEAPLRDRHYVEANFEVLAQALEGG
jgi:hypothetical protein